MLVRVVVMGGILVDGKDRIKDCQASGPDNPGWHGICLRGTDTKEEQHRGGEDEFSWEHIIWSTCETCRRIQG